MSKGVVSREKVVGQRGRVIEFEIPGPSKHRHSARVFPNDGGPHGIDCGLISLQQAGPPGYFAGTFQEIRERMVEIFMGMSNFEKRRHASELVPEFEPVIDDAPLTDYEVDQVTTQIMKHTLTIELLRMYDQAMYPGWVNIVIIHQRRRGSFLATVDHSLDFSKPCVFIVHYPRRHHYEACEPIGDIDQLLAHLMQKAFVDEEESQAAALVQARNQAAAQESGASDPQPAGTSSAVSDLERENQELSENISRLQARLERVQARLVARGLLEPSSIRRTDAATIQQEEDDRRLALELQETFNTEDHHVRQDHEMARRMSKHRRT